jgi:tocopherol O-methyltransferase
MIVSKRKITSEDVARHYDDLDAVYRETWGQHLHHGLWISEADSTHEAVKNLSMLVIKRLQIRHPIQNGARICDIGCGYAATARLIAERFSANVTGITLSKAQLEHAKFRRPSHGQVHLHQMNWLENDLPDQSFDHAFAIESSEHMEDLRKFFSEAYRVLKPGGSFAVCAWLSRENPSPMEQSLLLEPICRHGKLLGLGSEDEYRKLLSESGFYLEHFEDLSSQVSRTWSVCAARFIRDLPTDSSKFWLLFKKENPQLGFFLSLFRMQLAYRLGAMRYGIFTATKPLSA